MNGQLNLSRSEGIWIFCSLASIEYFSVYWWALHESFCQILNIQPVRQSRFLLQSQPAAEWWVWTAHSRLSTCRRFAHSFLPISFVSINRSHFHYSFLSPLIQPLCSTLAVADTEEWAASKKLPPCKDVFLSENKRCCQKTSPPDIVVIVVLTGSCRVKEAVGCSVRPFLPTPVQHRLQWVWNCLKLNFNSRVLLWC